MPICFSELFHKTHRKPCICQKINGIIIISNLSLRQNFSFKEAFCVRTMCSKKWNFSHTTLIDALQIHHKLYFCAFYV